MTEWTSISISQERLADLREKKADYYGELADEISMARFIEDVTDEVAE